MRVAPGGDLLVREAQARELVGGVVGAHLRVEQHVELARLDGIDPGRLRRVPLAEGLAPRPRPRRLGVLQLSQVEDVQLDLGAIDVLHHAPKDGVPHRVSPHEARGDAETDGRTRRARHPGRSCRRSRPRRRMVLPMPKRHGVGTQRPVLRELAPVVALLIRQAEQRQGIDPPVRLVHAIGPQPVDALREQGAGRRCLLLADGSLRQRREGLHETGGGQLGRERKRALHCGQRLLALETLRENERLHGECLGKARSQGDSPAVALQRLRQAAQREQDVAVRKPCVGQVRSQPQQPLEALQRLVEAPERPQRMPPVVPGLGVCRHRRQHLVEVRDGFRVPPHEVEDVAVVEDHQRCVRRPPQRRADQPLGRREVALLALDDAQQIERVDVGGFGIEHGLVGAFGLGEAAGAMVLQGRAHQAAGRLSRSAHSATSPRFSSSASVAGSRPRKAL